MRLFSLSAEEPSLIEELWHYFVDKYFTIEYGNYEHINVTGSGFFSPGSMVICLFIGIVLASLMALFSKRVLGDFVRAISRDKALSPAKALTLEQLGFLKNSAVRGALKRHGSLRRTVRCVEDDIADIRAGVPLRPGIAELYPDIEPTPGSPDPGKTDLGTAHFYIPEAEIYTAEIRYEKKGTNWLGFFMTIVVSIIAASILFTLLPDVFQLVDNFIGIVKPTGNILQ